MRHPSPTATHAPRPPSQCAREATDLRTKLGLSLEGLDSEQKKHKDAFEKTRSRSYVLLGFKSGDVNGYYMHITDRKLTDEDGSPLHCKVSLQKALAHHNGIPGGISAVYDSAKKGRRRAIQNASKAIAQVGSHAQLLTHSTLAEGAQLPSDPLRSLGIDADDAMREFVEDPDAALASHRFD